MSSPWTTRITVQNQTNRPVLMHLARNANSPSAANAVEYTMPAENSSALVSGWLEEPKATILVRTGLREAKIIRASDTDRLVVSLAPHGLIVNHQMARRSTTL